MRSLNPLLLACCALSIASPAFAETTAVILGVRSVEGDDDVAHDITQALRVAAASKSGWSLSESEVSMAQMMLANGCEEVDAACLSQIAKGLAVARLVYGTVRRNSAQAEYDYDLTVSLFDAERSTIARTLNQTIPRAQAGFRSMGDRAEHIILQLSSVGREGVIVVAANVPAAAVRLDDEPVGETSEGLLRLEGVSPGEHRVEIQASGYAPHTTRVTLAPGGEASVQAELAAVATEAPAGRVDTGAPSGGGDLEWLGWTLVGVGAASLVGMGASALVVNGVQDDPLFVKYKTRIAADNARAGFQAVKDVCVEADRGLPHGLEASEVEEVASMCSRADTFEVLEWVFLGTAIVAGGAGAYILVTSEPGSDAGEARARAPALSLRPIFDGQTAAVNASLRF